MRNKSKTQAMVIKLLKSTEEKKKYGIELDIKSSEKKLESKFVNRV
jgi:hypothetical protein